MGKALLHGRPATDRVGSLICIRPCFLSSGSLAVACVRPFPRFHVQRVVMMLLQILQLDDVMLEVILPPLFGFGQISGPLRPSLLISWDCCHVRVLCVLRPRTFCSFYAFTNAILALAAVDSMRNVRLILAVFLPQSF